MDTHNATRLRTSILLLLLITILAAALPAVGQQPDPPLLHWEFDPEGGSTILDSSGKGHTAPKKGEWFSDPDQGNVLYLPEGHGQVTADLSSSEYFDFDATQHFSVAFWIKPEKIVSYSQHVGAGPEKFLFKFNGSGYMRGGIASTEEFQQADCTEPIDADEWQHVAFTYGDGYARIYEDGRLVCDKYVAFLDLPPVSQVLS